MKHQLNNNLTMNNLLSKTSVKSKIFALISLFFLAPFMGEFLLGNISVTMLGLLPVLGFLYGVGSILIREYAVRLKLQWNGILILCLVYAILEEAFYTQSLFDPNYLGLRLLDYGYIQSLEMGAWWTVYVLGIHIIWSTAVPIALIDFLFPKTRNKPLLGKSVLIIASILFLIYCILPLLSRLESGFLASGMQFFASIIVMVILAITAYFVGHKKTPFKIEDRKIPSPLLIGLIAFILCSIFISMTFTIKSIPAAFNIAGMLIPFVSGCILFWFWFKSAQWSKMHALMLTGGLMLTYVWFGFIQVPSVGETSKIVDFAGNSFFSMIAITLFYVAYKKTKKENTAIF